MWFYCSHCNHGIIVMLDELVPIPIRLAHACGRVMRMVGKAAEKIAA